MLAPGVRVVRGPDWIWQNQDGGEGHVGTICEIGRLGSTHSPEKTVVVNWDTGHRTNYRVGYQGQYDLIVIDNAQIGVKHANIICNGCSKAGIAGIRFRCAHCTNFDLCASCYGSDIHDLDHPFVRYQTANSVGVQVTSRENSEKLQLQGIFVGARVIRGPDWEWGQQDGGDGRTGRVMEIRGWDNESCRSVANVSWSSGSTNVYRLGHKGNVDLKYVLPASGGYYYRDHMPVLGQPEEQQPVVPALRPIFSVGDRVKVCLDKESLMKLQQGHGGWNPRMAEYLSKIGTVHRITDKADIRVQYDACANRWTFHPAALVKVCTFHIGDLVTIIYDHLKVQQLQKGHGEWVEAMKNALGKTGKVVKVYADKDLRISMLEDGFEWTLNPKCVKLERSPLASAAERSNSMMDLSHQRTDHVMMPLSGLSGSSAADKLVRDAAQGKIEYVQQYLGMHPDQVDVMSGGKTCLQVAAHQGHVTIVRLLIALEANINVVDKEGDSTLHYAAFGNQPEIMRILLHHGADINVLNASHCSALHISAHKKPPHCVKILLEYEADVNIQDSYGDTALHDAIGKENREVIELLCNAPNLDLTVRNIRGFNALHHASLKGNKFAAMMILEMARQLVDVKKDDGFAALHLAALNGHGLVAECLVAEGGAEIDIRNNRRQTPFLLAVSQGHCEVIERLINLNCNIQAKDEDGDNAMHLCVIKKANLNQEPDYELAPKINEIYQVIPEDTDNRLMYAILCFLAKEGCRIEPNFKGATIFDWLQDQVLCDLIQSYANKSTAAAVSPTPAARGGGGGAGIDDIIDQQIYSNIQGLNLDDTGDANTSGVSITDQEPSQDAPLPPNIPIISSGSNPPTPARRHRHHNNREISTPSPSTQQQNDDETAAPCLNNFISKKVNNPTPPALPPSNRLNTMSPGPADGPTTSSHSSSSSSNQMIDSTPSSESAAGRPSLGSHSPSRNIKENKLNPSTPNIISNQSKHISRKQLNNNSNKITPNQECIVCNEATPLITFEPCYHQISCEDCGIRMKKCFTCGTYIEKRIDQMGRVLSSNKEQQYRQPSADRLRYLETKILEIEETHCCSICMERRRNVAFLCGHGACSKCADTLKICHMCRKTIGKKINLY